jgi:hypothetical protein
LLAAAIAGVWYLPMYQRHGYEFIDEFFIQHHFARFTSNKYQHPQPFYFFLWVLPLMTLPWLPFFLGAIWRILKTIFQRREAKTGRNRQSAIRNPQSLTALILFSAAWILVPLAFFSFSGSKLPGYILPAAPAAIILTTTFVFSLVRNSKKWRNAMVLVAVSTFATMILLLVFVVPRFAETDSIKSLIEAANERGYQSNRVLTLHTISHNAEFYAAGRLLRDDTGKQRRLSGANEILAEISAAADQPVIVLVPLEYLPQLIRDERIRTEVLKDNGELAITVVAAK